MRNEIRTFLLLAGVSVLILLIGGAVGGGLGLAVALVIAVVVCGAAYFFGDRVALSTMRARPVSEVEQPLMYRIVRELSNASRQPMPRLYVSPTEQPNAFATGRNPRHAAVCCTYGALAVLDESELRGVLAHEMSHVYNRDILISSAAGALATSVTWPAGIGSLGRRSDGPGLLGGIMLVVLGPLAASIIQLAISRTREFRADASGARLTGDPLALASALRKIEEGTRSLPLADDGRLASASHLMIANPFGGSPLARLFSTHPAAGERIAKLESQAGYLR